jgi:hypothetical protein
MARRSPREGRESRIASGWIVEGDPVVAPAAPAEEDGDPAPESALAGPEESGADSVAAEPRPQMSSGVVVLLGVIGGVYLLYTWVWFSWASYYSSVNAAIAEGSGVLGSVMQQVVFWAAPLAPILWFVSVLVLVRVSRPRALMVWLLVGAVVLVPLPMLSFGGA